MILRFAAHLTFASTPSDRYHTARGLGAFPFHSVSWPHPSLPPRLSPRLPPHRSKKWHLSVAFRAPNDFSPKYTLPPPQADFLPLASRHHFTRPPHGLISPPPRPPSVGSRPFCSYGTQDHISSLTEIHSPAHKQSRSPTLPVS